VFLVDIRWAWAERSELFFNVTWADTSAGFATLRVAPASDVPIGTYFPDGLPGPGADTGPLLFADYDFTTIHEYSDVSYEQLRSTVGANVQVRPMLNLFGSISYYDTQDNDPYLIDATGDVWLYAGGLSFQF
jgi:hypothetical protein